MPFILYKRYANKNNECSFVCNKDNIFFLCKLNQFKRHIPKEDDLALFLVNNSKGR